MAKRKNKQKSGIQGERVASIELCLPTPEFMAKNPVESVKTDLGGYAMRVQDKRPIDMYHRLNRIDDERGVAEINRRGINESQYRAADRMACNYERCFPKGSKPIEGVRVQSSVNSALFPVESMMNAIHFHTRIMEGLSRMSQEILERVCCREGSLAEFEIQRGWRKGYGMARLREALDELAEAYRAFGKAQRTSPSN